MSDIEKNTKSEKDNEVLLIDKELQDLKIKMLELWEKKRKILMERAKKNVYHLGEYCLGHVDTTLIEKMDGEVISIKQLFNYTSYANHEEEINNQREQEEVHEEVDEVEEFDWGLFCGEKTKIDQDEYYSQYKLESNPERLEYCLLRAITSYRRLENQDSLNWFSEYSKEDERYVPPMSDDMFDVQISIAKLNLKIGGESLRSDDPHDRRNVALVVLKELDSRKSQGYAYYASPSSSKLAILYYYLGVSHHMLSKHQEVIKYFDQFLFICKNNSNFEKSVLEKDDGYMKNNQILQLSELKFLKLRTKGLFYRGVSHYNLSKFALSLDDLCEAFDLVQIVMDKLLVAEDTKTLMKWKEFKKKIVEYLGICLTETNVLRYDLFETVRETFIENLQDLNMSMIFETLKRVFGNSLMEQMMKDLVERSKFLSEEILLDDDVCQNEDVFEIRLEGEKKILIFKTFL